MRIATIKDNKISKAGEKKATQGSRIDKRFAVGSAEDWVKTGKRVRVKSSNVRYIQYDKPAQRLYVEFKGGDTYYYPSVAPAVARKMFNAPSMGKFVWYLRRAGYVGIKV